MAEVGEVRANASRIESQLTSKLNQILSPKHYVLSVDVETSQRPADNSISLIPGGQILGPSGAGELDYRNVAKVIVRVMLSDHYEAATRNQIRQIIASQLPKLASNQLEVSFAPLTIKPPPVSAEMRARVEASERQAADMQRQSTELRREREDLNNQLRAFVDRIEKIPEMITEKAESQPDTGSNATASEEPWELPLEVTIFLFVVAFAIALIGLFAFLGLGKLGNSLESGIQSMSSKGGLGGFGRDAAPQVEAAAVQAAPAPTETAIDEARAHSLNEFNTYLSKMKEQLEAELVGDRRDVLLTFVIEKASSDTTVETAALALEVLGEDIVRELVRKIPSKQRRRIRNYFNYQKLGTSEKMKNMASACEQVLSAITSAKIGDQEEFHSESLALRIVSYELEDLVVVLGNLSEAGLARCLGYLKPEILGAVISYFAGRDEGKISQILTASTAIPFYLEKPELDQEIKSALDEYDLVKKETNQLREHRSFYLKLLESTKDSAKSSVIDSLRKIDADFASELDAMVITFESFWRLPSSIQLNMLEKMSVQMIAVLSIDQDNAERREILRGSLSGPQQQLLDDEMERLGTDLSWNNLELLRNAKAYIVSEIENVARVHDLSTIMSPGNDESLEFMKYKMTG